MKRTLSILLTLALLMGYFHKVGIYAAYQLNKDYIAEMLCINKDKPELSCEGMCQLKKNLAKDDEQQESPATLKNAQETQWFCNDLTDLAIVRSALTQTITTPYLTKDHSADQTSLFRPPQV